MKCEHQKRVKWDPDVYCKLDLPRLVVCSFAIPYYRFPCPARGDHKR